MPSGGTAHHRDVEATFLEGLDGVLAVADDQLDLDGRMHAREGGEHLRSEIFRGRDHADGDAAAGERPELGQSCRAIGEHGFDLFRASQHLAAGLGEREAAAIALEQRQAGGGLELVHLHGHRRRGDVAGLSGGGKAAPARRRAEEPELFEADVADHSLFLNVLIR